MARESIIMLKSEVTDNRMGLNTCHSTGVKVQYVNTKKSCLSVKGEILGYYLGQNNRLTVEKS